LPEQGKQERLPAKCWHDMDGIRNTAGRVWIALLCCAVTGTGCARWRLPRIDPSGERIFLPHNPGASQGGFLRGGLPGHRRAIVPPPDIPRATPAQGPPPVAPTIPAPVPPPATTAPVTPAPAITAPVIAAPVMAGPVSSLVPPGLHVTPREVVAPIGSEVVLIAGIGGPRGNLVPGERIEWILASGGVGQLVAVGDANRFSLFRHRDQRPRKISNTFAIGVTSNRVSVVTRGTPDPIDDSLVQPGQTWITVASAMEGTSYVTAFAPKLTAWDQRQAIARIHWIDARWAFPPSTAHAMGHPASLTTVLSRNSDSRPIHGWPVRYEILGGAPAQLSANGAQVVEVPTDATGRARIDVTQTDVRAGATHIGVQVIRPPLAGQTDPQPLLLGCGTTTVTWTSSSAAPAAPVAPAAPAAPAQPATVITMRMFGPDRATPHATATYRIELGNPGPTALHDLKIEAPLPPGWGHMGGTPAPQLADGKVVWTVAEIGPGQTKKLEVTLRVAGRGPMRFCASAHTSDGQTVQRCAVTVVVAPAIGVRLTGPQRARVGSHVRFEVVITNHGDSAAENLVVTDTFDEGLKHLVATSPIERAIGRLAAGASTTVALNFQVTRAGHLCHHAVVTGQGDVHVTADACLEATQAPPPPVPQAALAVTKKGPRQRHAGESADFQIVITNTGNVALTNVRVSDSYERPLEPTDASAGFTVTAEALTWVFPQLDPGATEKIRVRCRCVQPARRACNRVIASSDQGATIADEACVEILPSTAPPLTPPANRSAAPPAPLARSPEAAPAQPPSQPSPSQPPVSQPPPPASPSSPPARPPMPAELSMTIADLADPVRVGDKVTYQIRVHNDGSAKAGPLTVVVTFPENLTPARIGTVSPAASYKIAGQTLRFAEVTAIAAGDTLTYRVPFIATQPGKAQVRAEVTARGLDQPIEVEEKTDVLKE